jgi:hypothetical protein
MNLQDLKCKLESLKLKWIKQLEDETYNSPWKSYLSSKFKDKATNIPHYNYDIANYPVFRDNFYAELFQVWNKAHSINIETYEDIYRQNIMHNRNIKIEQQVIKSNNWGNHGIKYIGHLISDNGNIMPKHEVELKYNLNCKYLQYESLTSAIPSKWKRIIKENKGLAVFDLNDTTCYIKIGKCYKSLKEISTKEIYWHLVETISKRPTSENKWNEKLPFIIDNDMWTIIYMNHKHVTTDTYVLNLQYKITHRIMACNKNLHTWKLKNNSICDHCTNIDTIEHFLVECQLVYTFWQQVFNWWAVNLELWFQVAPMKSSLEYQMNSMNL